MADNDTPETPETPEGVVQSEGAMADGAAVSQDTATARRGVSRWFSRIGKVILGLLAAIILAFVAGFIWLNTDNGKGWITDQIASVAPASGLRFEVGRIEGSVYSDATLYNVKVYDPRGQFMEVPRIELDWRPLAFLFRGLDVRKLTLHDGTLYRVPELLPGDPDAPILPDFDIRVDRLEIDNLTVVEGVAGPEQRTVNLVTRADIREGRAYVVANGELGGGDRLALLLDAEPDADRFDIDLDYRAPAGGLLASMVGAQESYRARVVGDGNWSEWRGGLLVQRAGERFAAFRLTNDAGRYTILGQAYPEGLLEGLPGRVVGERVSLRASGTLEQSILDGEFTVRMAGVDARGGGAFDLDGNSVDEFEFFARLRDPQLFGESVTLTGATIEGVANGAFRDLSVEHTLRARRIEASGTQLADLRQSGVLTYDGARWIIPLDARVSRIVTGQALADSRLRDGSVTGTLVYTGRGILSDNLAIRFPDLSANLALSGDLERGVYGLAGPVSVRQFALENLGSVSGRGDIRFRIGTNTPWRLSADVDGRMTRIDNATLADLSGGNIRFRGGVSLGAAQPIVFQNARITSNKLTATLGGRVADGTTQIAGSGRHTEYGPFTVEATLADDGPRATLVFADPYPAAGLTDVRVALAPIRDGFRIDTTGGSMLGAFDGVVNFYSRPGGPTRLNIEQLTVARTNVTGDITLGGTVLSGNLDLNGGGVSGTIALAPRGGRQGFDVDLVANNASFDGPSPIRIASARINANGVVGGGSDPTAEGDIDVTGLRYGTLFVNRLVADVSLDDGVGRFAGAMSGRQRSRFTVQFDGRATQERIAVALRGEYADRPIRMPRRAVFVKQQGGGWELQRTQINFAGGSTLVSGMLGGASGTSLDLQLADMPLSLVDLAGTDLGLGGRISGEMTYNAVPGGLPTGEARVLVDGLTRSGLVLTSDPIDLAFVGRLDRSRLQARAVLREGGGTRGRMQAVISALPASGGLAERLQAGRLFAQLRYAGPAGALWRLAALDAFDLSGQLNLAADVTGSLGNPQLRGSLGGDNMRLRSSITGTDVTGMRLRGSFAGSRLRVSEFRGTTGNGGAVSGSGTVDLANLGSGRGPEIDLRIAARNARLVERDGLGATVTGPLRIVSNGVGGTIAGRVAIDRANWQLGGSEAVQRLPNIQFREINRPASLREARAVSSPWRFLIDAQASDGIIDVDGMGLDSEWEGNILLRGTTEDPRIGGRVTVRRGAYSFAGTRFELERGIIDFDENVPIDPRLNILAESDVDGLTVQVNVRGTAQQPQIDFSSIPALPEEELLARILFGGSIADLSATDALQLGAALASLRGGGGGMDPINQLRTAIGLDRLRIIAADPAIDRGTAIALGKNITNSLYVEIITDGRGYTATELEFEVTSWLSLLATISSIGRESVAAEYRRDY